MDIQYFRSNASYGTIFLQWQLNMKKKPFGESEQPFQKKKLHLKYGYVNSERRFLSARILSTRFLGIL